MTSPILAVQEVHKGFGAHEIVRGVSFEVAAGEVVAIVGSSGAGKSTLLRCLNYLAAFERGRVEVAGNVLTPGLRPTERQVRAARRQVGMVFQDFQLFPHLDATGNVALGPRHVLHVSAAEAHARAERTLARVHLSDRACHYPSQLSGGQRQRVGIARALAMEPKLLLLDEPTSSLDPVLKEEVVRVLLELKRDGMTMVLVTHEHELARTLADRVLTLAAGRIATEGRPSDLR